MDPELLDILEHGVALFNRQEFFEAHDVWEDHWLNVSGHERLLLQGLIQTAAAFYKLQLGNVNGMAKLLADAAEALGKCASDGYGIDLPAVRACVAEWKQAAEGMVRRGSVEHDPAILPKLAFVRPPVSP